MARVVAVDATVAYASIVILTAGEIPKLAYRVTDKIVGSHHPAADAKKHQDFAAEVVAAALTFGKPDLVVLRKPNISTVTTHRRTKGSTKRWDTEGDASALRRMGVHWELVTQFAEAGVPIAEVSKEAVEMALLKRIHPGYAPLAQRCQELYPDAACPLRVDDDGNDIPDLRYRMTTLGLALVGAVSLGIGVPVTVNDAFLDALTRGCAFPPGFAPPAANEDYSTHAALRRRNTKAERDRAKERRASDWYERQLEDIRTLPIAELEARKCPKNPTLAREWKKRVNAEV